jgi:trans-aconitate methyltransferase
MEKRDIPINTQKKDQFDMLPYVKGLSEFIRNSEKPITISIQGEWGSGKTSLMNMIEEELCRDEEEGYSGIWINTWDYFLENDYDVAVNKLVMTFISEIEKKYENVKCGKSKEEIIKDFKRFTLNFSKAVLGFTGRDSDSGNAFLDEYFGINSSANIWDIRRKFEGFITEIIEGSKGVDCKTFIIFVDDLDRIRPKLAVTILEALKILFDIKHCVFIIAIDYDVVAKGVEEKYGKIDGNGRDIGRSYFDKLIQLPFVMPTAKYDITDMVMNRLREMKFMNTDHDYRVHKDDIIEIIKLTTNNNPRIIKRLLSMLQLTIIMDRERLDNSSAYYQMVELLLVAMQLAYPTIYQMLQSNENFTSWKKNILINIGEKAIDESIKEGFDIDCEWKEVVYLLTVNDPMLRMNYTKISSLLELFRKLASKCEEADEHIDEIFGVLSMTDVNSNSMLHNLYNGQDYDKSSQTQYKQGDKLIGSLDLKAFEYVLDVGCGNGKTTFELIKSNPKLKISAFDISETQIEVAKQSCRERGYTDSIDFYVMDALKLADCEMYDLVFSNATLHWITSSKKMYTLLHNALKIGGKLAVHQGGDGSYKGLHAIVMEAAKNLGLDKELKGWTFPVFYPTKEEMEKLLQDIGFRQISVESVHSDGREYDHLIENFEKASLIFYKPMLKSDEDYQALVEEYYKLCSLKTVDTSTHRLYIHALK